MIKYEAVFSALAINSLTKMVEFVKGDTTAKLPDSFREFNNYLLPFYCCISFSLNPFVGP